MFDDAIDQYFFDSVQDVSGGMNTFDMCHATERYAAIVRLPWLDIPAMSNTDMTIYGRRIMQDMLEAHERGRKTGEETVRRAIRKNLGI